MQNFKNIVIVILAIVLTGCASTSPTNTAAKKKTQSTYAKEAKSVSPTQVPQGLTSQNIQSYYPIPPVSMGPTTSPSLVPPGSQAAQIEMAKQGAAPVAASPVVNQAASSGGSLVLNLDYQKAWGKVGQALHAAKYQVLQQDRTIGAYYVLDTASTGGQLKTSTPIYQVHLNPSGNSTSVILLNDKNQPADGAVSSRILGALKRNM